MDRPKLAWMWASAILAAALASGFGLIDESAAEGLYLGLVLGAVANLAQAPCRSC